MNLADLLILSITQGLTEFIPVSSSGHLVLLSGILNVQASAATLVTFFIFLHFGTLIAVLVYFRRFIFRLIKGILSKDKKSISTAIKIVIGSIPAFIVGALFALFIEETLSGNSEFLIAAIALIVTGSIFLISKKFYKNEYLIEKFPIAQTLIVGVAQAIAVIPGVSRSGLTTTAARITGLNYEDSLSFSFYLSIPVILGATAYSVLKDFDVLTTTDLLAQSLFGMVISFIVGFISIKYLFKYLNKHNLDIFGYYCITIGIIALVSLVI